jgi:zinc transporter ZupT
MATYWHVIFYSFIGGVFSLLGGVLLLSRQKTATVLAKYATPFAAGALLAAVFLDLLTDGLEESTATTLMWSALSGVVLFFFWSVF